MLVLELTNDILPFLIGISPRIFEPQPLHYQILKAYSIVQTSHIDDIPHFLIFQQGQSIDSLHIHGGMVVFWVISGDEPSAGLWDIGYGSLVSAMFYSAVAKHEDIVSMMINLILARTILGLYYSAYTLNNQ